MKPSFLARIRSAASSALAAFKGVTWTSGDWVSSDLPGNRYSSGEWGRMADVDYSRYAGASWNCPAFQAGLNFLMRNAPQAPPIIQKEQDDGRWVKTDGGDALKLLRRPNEKDGWPQLVGAIMLSLLDKDRNGGNAFIAVDWNVARTKPVALWWLPHTQVTAIKEPRILNTNQIDYGDNKPIDFYEYRVNNKIQRLNLDEMIHIAFGISPWDQKVGMSPTGSSEEGIYTLKRTGKFTSNIMKRGGATSLYFTPANSEDELDPVAFVEDFNSAHSGENVGSVGAYSIPLNVEKLNSTPQEMAIDTLPDRSESDIASLTGVPSSVTGLHSSRNSKTYANQKEAREEVWEGTLVPYLYLISEAFTRQLLPLFGIDDPKIRVFFDDSMVSALAPERDRRAQAKREDFRAQCIDRYTYLIETGRTATDKDKGVYYSGLTRASDGRTVPGDSVGQALNDEGSSVPNDGSIKAITRELSDRVISDRVIGNGVTA